MPTYGIIGKNRTLVKLKELNDSIDAHRWSKARAVADQQDYMLVRLLSIKKK